MDSFWRPFLLKFLGKSHAQVRERQIAPPSLRFCSLTRKGEGGGAGLTIIDHNCQPISARQLAQLLLKVFFCNFKRSKNSTSDDVRCLLLLFLAAVFVLDYSYYVFTVVMYSTSALFDLTMDTT